MKKIFVIIFLIVAVGYLLYKQQVSLLNQDVTGLCEDVNMEIVYTKASQIENELSGYSHTTRDVMGQSTEGGEQTNYMSGSNLVFIKQIFYGETGKSEISYYLNNDSVFYIKKENTEYLLPLSEDSSAKTKSIEVKDFFLNQDQKLCSWYKNKQLQVNNSETIDLLDYLVSGIK